MRIDLRDIDREFQGRFTVDPQARPASVTDEAGRTWPLQWEGALDDRSRLLKCPVCACRQLFRRRDFPQGLGLTMVIVAGFLSVVLFAFRHVTAAIVVLALAVLIDGVIWFFTGECVVCYRCRSEFRGEEISPEVESWEIEIGEKYRPIHRLNESASSEPSHSSHAS